MKWKHERMFTPLENEKIWIFGSFIYKLRVLIKLSFLNKFHKFLTNIYKMNTKLLIKTHDIQNSFM